MGASMGDWGSGQYGSYGGGGDLEAAKSGGGFDWGGFSQDLMGFASAGMNIGQRWVKYEGMRKRASGLHDDYKELMKRANQALEQGWTMAMDIRREGAEILGEQSAFFGKSGTTMEGSPLLIEADTKRKIELAAGRAIEQAWLDYIAMRYRAKKEKKAAKAAATAADVMGGEAIAGGIMDIATLGMG